MLRNAVGKVTWMARATTTVVGLAIMLALVFGVASTALGKNGQALILGKGNNVATKVTGLIGKVASGPALMVKNPSGGSALGLEVGAGQAPLTVNAGAGKATNLNADKVDGLDSAQLVQGGGRIHRFGSVDMNSGDAPQNLAAVGPFTLQGRCRNLNSTTELFLRNNASGPWSFAVNSSNEANPALAALSNLSEIALIATLGNGKSVTASGYAHALSVDKQIFFEVYQYRVADFLGNESCTFGGYVVE